MRYARVLAWLLMASLFVGSAARADGLWPSDWFAKKPAAKPAPKKPSSFDKLASNTKKMFTPDKKPATSTHRTTVSRKSGYDTTRTANRNPKQSPSVWEQWFGPEEPQKPATIKEWMSQPRVKP